VSTLLAAAWILQKILSVGGLLIALSGVATFGWFFVRSNAVAAQGESGAIPPESWRGTGPRYGLYLFAAGVGLAIASMLLAALLAG
jgi:hypothetical protein